MDRRGRGAEAFCNRPEDAVLSCDDEASLIRDNDTLPPKFVAAIDRICRDYCDYRPAFVSLVFAKLAETAGSSPEMEAWVRENFTLLVTTGPEQGSNMNVSVDVVHNARRESLPVTAHDSV
jgi:hypothetical protein